jgi:hypothetical protein
MKIDAHEIFGEHCDFPLFAVIDEIDKKLYANELFTKFEEAEKFRVELERLMLSLVCNDFLVVEIHGKNDVRMEKYPIEWLGKDSFYFCGSSKYNSTTKCKDKTQNVDGNSKDSL